VTAYSIWNAEHGVHLQGYNAQKASFSRTINVKQIGHAFLHLDAYNEDYLITLPSLHIEGLITGSPYVELESHSYIQSSSGYTANISYSGKGWVSGKKNSFTATLFPEGKEKEPIYTAEGQWSDSFVIKDAKTRKEVESHEAKKTKTTPLTISPIDTQDPMESRRAWAKVAAAIQKGDTDMTGREKTVIEEKQREMRRKEKEENREWERRYFARASDHSAFDKLAKKMPDHVSVDKEKTNGVWRFDENKAKDFL